MESPCHREHESFNKTYERLRKSFYWKGITVDIKRFIANCENCQLNKRNEIPEPTEKFATQVEAPFTHLGIDIIGPLPETSSGNQYIIVIVDYFTKWVKAQLLSLLHVTSSTFCLKSLQDLVH